MNIKARYEAVITHINSNRSLDIEGKGDGRFESVVHALAGNIPNLSIKDLTYDEHGIDKGANSNAITYLSFKDNNAKEVWGVGIDKDILTSSIYALFSAINRIM